MRSFIDENLLTIVQLATIIITHLIMHLINRDLKKRMLSVKEFSHRVVLENVQLMNETSQQKDLINRMSLLLTPMNKESTIWWQDQIQIEKKLRGAAERELAEYKAIYSGAVRSSSGKKSKGSSRLPRGNDDGYTEVAGQQGGIDDGLHTERPSHTERIGLDQEARISRQEDC